MSTIIVLGAGLGGTMMAYDLRNKLEEKHDIILINQGNSYQFVPSNPWIATGFRKRSDVEVPLEDILHKKKIIFETCGAKKIIPSKNSVTLNDERIINYDYIVLSTGPDFDFDAVSGLGPDKNTLSICKSEHAEHAFIQFKKFLEEPGPIVVGAAQGASCFGPAYEFVLTLDYELRKRKIRDQVPITFITPEPYIGHLGLDGVGDTKGLLESEFRQRDIKWISNSRILNIEKDRIKLEELNQDGIVKETHDLDSKFSMIIPAFKGVKALQNIDGLVNPKGFVLVNDYQQNPTYRNIFAIGVCIAIASVNKTPVPVGIPKTGFMIETMVSAASENIQLMIDHKEPQIKPTWNALCLADFGDSGVAFYAEPQLGPRNVNWSSEGIWVHYAKIMFEKYFLYKVKHGDSQPFYEKFVLEHMGINLVKKYNAPKN